MSLRGGSLTASAQTRMALLQCDWQGKVAEWHFGFRIQSAGVTQVVFKEWGDIKSHDRAKNVLKSSEWGMYALH
ncbi:hypothetical protein N7533_005266 [Penicillium manginii]|uniref:uncharacterized protein n=1 Tax=Penicillium manginii TaxID=203109 RepID=UPI0025466008|nr:uncharacterized protein N7533_005266 [Penicillium manginii]KAJ5755723.1 hypothetical protein N7533_005266 [Penicillium manginii]